MPVFIAANVLIDVEVIADRCFAPGWPVHQLWHLHTLLIGGIAGAIFGAIIYYLKPLRWCSEKTMSLIALPGKSTLMSMLLAGLLGACFHVLVDSLYHCDVQIFWPKGNNPIWQWARRQTGTQSNLHRHVELACSIGWGLMGAIYAFLLARQYRKKKTALENQCKSA